MKSTTTRTKQTIMSLVLLAVIGSLGFASSASAADTACGPDQGNVPAWLMRGTVIDYSVTPNPWTSNMQGQTATVTVTGKTVAKIPLALLAYKTQPQTSDVHSAFPQELYKVDGKAQDDEYTLNGCETHTFTVQIPSCWYQVDFIASDLLDDTRRANAEFGLLVIDAKLGGSAKCNFTPPTTTEPPTTTTPPTTPTPTTPTLLTPVPKPVGGQGTTTTTSNVKGGSGSKRVCSSVAASSYRARVGLTSTVLVRVKTTSKSRPTVLLKGGGLGKYNRKTHTYAGIRRRVNSKGTVSIKIKPRKATPVRVTATGCAKVASVKIGARKRTATNKVSPTFTG